MSDADYSRARPRPIRNYAALALFVAVYAGVLLIVLAPRDFIAAEQGSVIRESD
jgi:hypothetical protein